MSSPSLHSPLFLRNRFWMSVIRVLIALAVTGVIGYKAYAKADQQSLWLTVLILGGCSLLMIRETVQDFTNYREAERQEEVA